MYSAIRCRGLLLGVVAVAFQSAAAQQPDSIHRDSARALQAVKIIERAERVRIPTMQLLTLPAIASVTAGRAAETVNLVDPEDAVKYLPSVFLRKRNYGDTQATLATRVWGVSSSARSLVFADGVPLTGLIANNNTLGGPRWGLVSPEEIARIDMMYGPYSAAYAGNSMGAVMEITTRQPDSLEGSIAQTAAMQRFDLYGTSRRLGTLQTSLTLGDRFGRFSFRAGIDRLDSHSQPLLYVTGTTTPSGTSGDFPEQNKVGSPANVFGATGLLSSTMTNARLKLAYDVTPTLRAAYAVGVWNNDAGAAADTYLASNSGTPTFAGQAAFAGGNYDLAQRHVAHSVSLRTARPLGDWDAEVVATRYVYDHDEQRVATTSSASDTTFGAAGRVVRLDGTGWTTLDLKGAWHRGGIGAMHMVSAGAHEDRYTLRNPTYNSPSWREGTIGTVATEGDGSTRTRALWAQDAWRLSPTLLLTVGGRLEWWRAFGGYNANGGTIVVQPEVDASRLSPKAVLAWTPNGDWAFTGSVGKAYRFATASELYQLVSTGATFTSPAPDLRPDDVLAAELRAVRTFTRGSVRLALFQDDVHDAIISQFLALDSTSTLYSYLSNVDHVRARGAELAFGTNGLLAGRLELSASVTGLDARILALSGRASATAPAGSAVGKFLPNIPRWRATAQTIYRPAGALALTLAGRYSSAMFTTLDDADVHPNTYQGFAEWLVVDARAQLRIDERWTAALGVDNLLDRKYFLFHPFPQRTFVASAKLAL